LNFLQNIAILTDLKNYATYVFHLVDKSFNPSGLLPPVTTANHSLRNNLFNKIILNKPYFIEETPLNKIKILLDANSELLTEVGDFIKQSTELQK
jgi:hypothetical protein